MISYSLRLIYNIGTIISFVECVGGACINSQFFVNRGIVAVQVGTGPGTLEIIPVTTAPTPVTLMPTNNPTFFGQQPETTMDDNPPDECLPPGPPFLIAERSIVCSENFDCVPCEFLQCNNCAEIVCNGDSSCRGIPMINIDGIIDIGALVLCNGDISCEETSMVGTEVASVTCDGDLSCKMSNFTFTGVSSGLGILCGGDFSCPNNFIDATNVVSYVCNGDGMLMH